jgi:methionyl-tRNA synthetase
MSVGDSSTRPKTYLVTCAPPNANGDLHLGHLSGPFLGADVCRRYLRQRGHDAHYISYTDDWSPWVLRKGEDISLSPQETAFVYGRRMEETLALGAMLPDYYERPFREPIHTRTVHRGFLDLWERGLLTTRPMPVFHCDRCDRYLYDAHVHGRCHHCGGSSGGMYCEECGRPQDSAALLEPLCIRCETTPSIRTIERIVFPMDRYRDQVRDYVEGASWRGREREFCMKLVEAGLPDTPISRLSPFGIPVPLPGWEGHILDSWFSGIFGYMAATAAYGEAIGRPEFWREVWEEPTSTIVQFIGFDCSFSHALLWPAMMMARGGINVPDQIVLNEYYLLEGEKFSTSRGYAIWGSDFLREVPSDALRFHLCLTGPEVEQTSFWRKEFVDKVNTVLVDELEAWEDRLFDVLEEDFDSTVPTRRGAARPGAVSDLLNELPATMAASLEPDTFSLQTGARAILRTAEMANGDLQDVTTAREDGDEGGYAEAVAGHVRLLAAAAASFAPIMPSWSQHVWRLLKLPFASEVQRSLPWPDGGRALIEDGHRVAPAARPMFHRL